MIYSPKHDIRLTIFRIYNHSKLELFSTKYSLIVLTPMQRSGARQWSHPIPR